MFVRLEIETYEEDGKKYVYLSDNGSSGCKYGYNNKDELKNILCRYCTDLVDYDK